MVACKSPFTQATRSLFWSKDPFLDFPRRSRKRDSSVSNKKATLDNQYNAKKSSYLCQYATTITVRDATATDTEIQMICVRLSFPLFFRCGELST